MNSNQLSGMLRRYALFAAGLFIASMGVAFSAKGALGTSPVASLPYSVSLVSPVLSFGSWLNVLSVIQIVATVIILKGKCNYAEIAVTTACAFVYGYLTDFSCWLIRGITVPDYLMQLVWMLLGCIVLAFGLWIQLKAGVAMLPNETLNRAISRVTGKKFELLKVFFDLLYVALAAAVSLIFLGELKGVREGSVIAAFAVGSIIRLLNHAWDRLQSRGKERSGIAE